MTTFSQKVADRALSSGTPVETRTLGILMSDGAIDAPSPFGVLPSHNVAKAALAFCLVEFALLCVGGFLANVAYGHFVLHWTPPSRDVAVMAIWLACAVVGGSLIKDEYQRCATLGPGAVLWNGVTSAAQGCALFLLLLFVLRPSDDISRGSILTQFIAVGCIVTIGRVTFGAWLRRGLSAGRLHLHRAMILGDPGRISGAVGEPRFLHNLRREGVEVARMTALPSPGAGEAEKGLLSAMVATCRADTIDTVIIIPTADTIGYAERTVRALAEMPVTVHVLPFGSMSGPTSASTCIGGVPSIVISHSPIDSLNMLFKRGFDVGAASLLLAALLPLMAVLSAAIKLESPGPVFFRQTRHGYGNRCFEVFKFRSMTVVEDGPAVRQAVRNDNRITRVGRFMRRTNLDELPQLLNVILGDMSLVGPRPHPVALNASFASRIRFFNRRHNILPGITGWAQVNGLRGETDTDEKMHSRIEHDLWYIDHWSILLDVRILFLTVFSSLAYRNAG